MKIILFTTSSITAPYTGEGLAPSVYKSRSKTYNLKLVVIGLLSCLNIAAADDNVWSFILYNGVMTEAEIERSVEKLSDINDSFKFTALGVSKKLRSVNQHLDLEIEGQVVKHWGEQHHVEINNLFLLRWRTFPWNRVVRTTLAVGDGLSYATRTPEFELIVNDRSTKLLNFLIWELTFAHPNAQHLSVLFRIHHRSGIFGLFSDISGGSNALALGVRYAF